jgi:hypothetical protein
VSNFFMIQEGKGPQDPPWDYPEYARLGPFINTSDNSKTYGAPAGNRTFIIFYWSRP